MMKSYYKKGDISVPDGFTSPTNSFKKQVILAMIGLIVFITTFIGLMVWFAYLSYNLFVASSSSDSILPILIAVGLAFLSIFMFKSLFIFKSGNSEIGMRITPENEPVLFDFINQLADEIGAPRPNKVFLTNRVNASVSYDLSIRNLIFPTKKNLEIGLGLVNVLNLGEFKAVLAHEFGHFAQRSMLLGRYVYTAQQIAVMVVNKRDALDKFLSGLSSVDIRIAWIGWILSILVWAIRSLIQTLFSIVSVAEKALSREMEFQADIVAVSVTGSDALINGLSKLKIADQAYHSVVDQINRELRFKKAVSDMFSLQTEYIDKMRWILDNPHYCKSPGISGPEHRVFTSEIVNPPQMWSTHPSDKDREENAKKIYIFSEIDETSVWDLFNDPKNLRLKVTADFVATAGIETELMSEEVSIKRYIDEEFNKQFLHPKYNGVFIERFPFINFKSIDEIYDNEVDVDDIGNEISNLYSKEFGEQTTQLKELNEEIQMLRNVKNEVFTFEKRKIMHRGNPIRRSEIDDIIKSIKKEEDLVRKEIKSKDKKCRKISYLIALEKKPEIASYLKSIAQVIHYSEHSITNLKDAYGKYNNVLAIAMADGKVSSIELNNILKSAYVVQNILKNINDRKKEIELDENLENKIKINDYSELIEEFKLVRPAKNNISDWAKIVGGWVNSYLEGLYRLRNGSLEYLLEIEEKINNSYSNNEPISIDYQPIQIVKEYKTILPGEERPLQLKLGFWDRFHVGDGFIPSAAKFAVSASIVFGALYLGNEVQKSDLYIFNGLATDVNVTLDDDLVYTINAFDKKTVNFSYSKDFQILTTDLKGDTIEMFKPNMKKRAQKYLYNIANSGLLFKQTISYGYDAKIPDYIIGFKRWLIPDVDFIMEDPPKSISTSKSSGTGIRTVIYAFGKLNPYSFYSEANKINNIEEAIISHTKWDHSEDQYVMNWLNLSSIIDKDLSPIFFRLKRNHREVISLRILMDNSDSTKLIACNHIDKLYNKYKDNADLFYLKTRCMEDSENRNQQFIEGYKKWKNNPWLAMASGYKFAGNNDWLNSYFAFGSAIRNNKAFRATYIADFERVNRYVKKIFHRSELDSLCANNSTIDYYRSLETVADSDFESVYDKIYNLINKGNLSDAISIAQKDEKMRPFFYRIIAASSNSPDSIVKKVLAYTPEEGINNNTLWMAIGTASANGVDYSSYLKQLESIERASMNYKVKVTEDFISFIKHNRLNSAEKLIKDIDDFRVQAKHYLLGSIILGKKAPKEWKIKANTLLFANEKPYIKM